MTTTDHESFLLREIEARDKIIVLMMRRAGITHAVYTSFELDLVKLDDLLIQRTQRGMTVSLTGS